MVKSLVSHTPWGSRTSSAVYDHCASLHKELFLRVKYLVWSGLLLRVVRV